MTVQLERPQPVVEHQRSPIVAGVVAATWAGAVGLALAVVVVLLVWALGPHGDANPVDVVRSGVLAWLYAHHAAVRVSGVAVTLAPLGALVVPGLLLYRAGRWAGRVSVEALPAAVAATASAALAYAVGAGLLASSTASTAEAGARAYPWSSAVGAGVLAFLCCGCGVMTGARLWSELPPGLVAALRGAAAGLAVLVGGGALLLAASLVVHAGRVGQLGDALHGGAVGGAALLLLGVLAVPSAVVWATSYAVGPGFAVGLGTAVAPAGIALGPVPAFPLLAALPGTGPAPAPSLLSLVVAPAAGAVVGLLAARRPTGPPGRAAAAALLSGVLAGVALGVLAALSAGSLGDVRLTQLGPHAFLVGVAAALEVGAVAAVVGYEAARHHALLAGVAGRVRAALHRR